MAYELTDKKNDEIRISAGVTQIHCDTPSGTEVRAVAGVKRYPKASFPFTVNHVEVFVGGVLVHTVEVFTGPNGHANVTLKDIEVAS